MNKCPGPTGLAMVLLATSLVGADNSPATRLSLKGLEGIGLHVAEVAPEAKRDGLLTDAIRTDVGRRLRDAGIPILTAEQRRQTLRRPSLEVNVATSRLETDEYLYLINLELVQWVALMEDPTVTVTGAIPVPATTWSPASAFGIVPAGQLARQVHATLDTLTAEFVDAYSKANPGP